MARVRDARLVRCALTFARLLRRAALRAELVRHSLQCTNPGCTSQPVCARFWRQHQEECFFAEVVCKHNAHGCVWRGTRQALEAHLEARAARRSRGCRLTLTPRATGLPLPRPAVVLEQDEPAAAPRAPRTLVACRSAALTCAALQLRHLCAHFEVALAHAGQQLAALRQWRNGNVQHYAEFLWNIFAEPQSYDTSVGRW